ncbi:MAG TPA: hypothetical protein VIT62_14325 [Lysobacter sp.]
MAINGKLIHRLGFAVLLAAFCHVVAAGPGRTGEGPQVRAATVAVDDWHDVPGGSWTPGLPDIEAAKAQIEPYVRRQAQLSHQTLPPWDSYTFQYQGQDFQGRKIIYVNAFCNDHFVNPAGTGMVVVFDGGPCFFQAFWDPLNKIFLTVLFNGQA